MKKILFILTICSITLTQELTVEGDLTVTGNIHSQTIDSLLQVIADLQAQLNALQGGVTSKLIEYNISVDNDEVIQVPIQDLIGFDIERGAIQFVGFEGDLISPLNIYFYTSEISGLNNPNYQFQIDSESQAANLTTNYYFDSNIDYMGFWYSSVSETFNGTLYFIVTAQFSNE